MFKKIDCYTVLCDQCWCNWLEDGEFCWFKEKDDCLDVLLCEDWRQIWDWVYCPDCWEYNEETEEPILKLKK